MKPPEIVTPAVPGPPDQSSLNSNCRIKKPPANKRDFKPAILPEKSKVAARFNSVIHHELHKPLVRINLSIEMLQSEIRDKDLNICLDIIMRSSIQIKKIIDELLIYKPIDKASTQE